ncbi:MAG: SCO family protein [Pseudomonadota bacterium]
MTRLAAIAAAFVVLAGLGGTYLWTQFGGAGEDQFAQCTGGAVGGDIGGPFSLVNSEGETVTEADVLDEPALIYFGYTFCPDVCPFDMARNAAAADILEERGMSVRPVFISVDPQRDTPEVVGDFAFYMGENVLGLTGTPEQVKAASEAYRTYYKAHPAEDDFYLVDHSTFTYLMLPGSGFADFFRRETSPEEMADRVGCFLEASGHTARPAT